MNKILFYFLEIYVRPIIESFKGIKNFKISNLFKSFKTFFRKPSNLDFLMILSALVLVIAGSLSFSKGNPLHWGFYIIYLFLLFFFHTSKSIMSGDVVYKFKQHQDKILDKLERKKFK